MTGHCEKRSKWQHDPDVHMADDDEGGSSHPNVTSEDTEAKAEDGSR